MDRQDLDTQLEALGELISVVATLRGPGGCPWDAKQTHESLVRYCLEEAYEVAEAIETRNRTDLREELGDLLLQIVFHADIAAKASSDAFDLGDIARQVANKMRERHPHVFTPEAGADTQMPVDDNGDLDLVTGWEERKKREKQRDSVLDGIPEALPVLARADKVLNKAARMQIQIPDPIAVAAEIEQTPEATEADGRSQAIDATAEMEARVGKQLLGWVAYAREHGIDPEKALRRILREYETDIRSTEAANPVL